eukprot:6967608-Pyramimonas_sp.AAC.1
MEASATADAATRPSTARPPPPSGGTPAALEDAGMMAEGDYAEAGYVYCVGAYWVPPQRLGWCR